MTKTRSIGPKSHSLEAGARYRSSGVAVDEPNAIVSFPDQRGASLLPNRPRIVVIDDDPSVCRSLMRLLRSLGMMAETFLSGDEFLTRWAAAPDYGVDCIILDLQMPRMSGLDVQARMLGSGIPIVFITAFDVPAAREQAMQAGAIAFLRKPFSDVLLLEILSTALKGRPHRKEDDAP